jgi:hypothetical protein
MATPELSDFFAVLRSGDGQAVELLLRQLDPILRRIIRLRLTDGWLRRLMDTTDIFQSLLKELSVPGREGPPSRTRPGRAHGHRRVPAVQQRVAGDGALDSGGKERIDQGAGHTALLPRRRGVGFALGQLVGVGERR